MASITDPANPGLPRDYIGELKNGVWLWRRQTVPFARLPDVLAYPTPKSDDSDSPTQN